MIQAINHTNDCLIHSFPTEGLMPNDLAFEAAGDEHVVPRGEPGADHEVLVDAQALADLHHGPRTGEVLDTAAQLPTIMVEG